MSDKIRPGMSIHVNMWLFLFVAVVLSLLANYLVKVDPEYEGTKNLARELSERLALGEVRVNMRGKHSEPAQDRTMRLSLYLSRKQYDDEAARRDFMDRAAQIVIDGNELQAGRIVVLAKAQVSGGCHPVYEEFKLEYDNPHYQRVKSGADGKRKSTARPPKPPK